MLLRRNVASNRAKKPLEKYLNSSLDPLIEARAENLPSQRTEIEHDQLSPDHSCHGHGKMAPFGISY